MTLCLINVLFIFRERELSDHEAVVNKLKGMYSQLEQTNRIQEEVRFGNVVIIIITYQQTCK